MRLSGPMLTRGICLSLMFSAVAHAQVITRVGQDGGVEAVSLHEPSIGGDVTRTGTDTFIDSVPLAARAVLRWDLSSVSVGTRVAAAHFDLNIINTGGDLQAYALLQQWSASQVSWLRRDTRTPWATPGADAPNVDRSATPVATVSPSTMGPLRVDFNDAGLTSVQSWVDQPALNSGLLLVLPLPQLNGVEFSGSQRTDGTQPRLVLELTDGGVLTFQNRVAPSGSYLGQVNGVLIDAPPSDTSALGWPLICNKTTPDLIHALLRFDLGEIPSNATVVAARLETQVLYSPITTAGVFLAPVLRPWDLEAASWRSAQRDGGTWAVPGLGPTDRAAPLIRATARFAGPLFFNFDAGTALAVVQQWVSNPSSNHGVILISDLTTGDGVMLGSLDAGRSERPVMVVTWFPFDAGTLDAGTLDAGEPDAGEPDAGEPDAGDPDAGEPDAGDPDAGEPGVAQYEVGCGCNESGALLLGGVALLLTRRRSTRRSGTPAHGA